MKKYLIFSMVIIFVLTFISFPPQVKASNTWTQQTGSGQHNWYSVASSSDGTKLAAVVNGGYIYTSTNGGVTWTEQTGSGQHGWFSIASSSDGTKLAAVNYDGSNCGSSGGCLISDLYISTDGGVTWTIQTSQHDWYSVASSSDGKKLAAVDNNNGYIYTYASSLSSPSVSTLSASPISSTSATLNANITSDGGDTITVSGFKYGLTTSYTTTTTDGPVTTGTYTKDITGLSCNTTYHFLAYATNAQGTTEGNDQSFTTSSCPTSGTNTGPTSEKFLSDITDGLITIDGGNPLSTPKVTVGVPYTIQAGDIQVVFPTGTEITKEGGGNIDFTQFTTIDTTSLTRESLTGTLGSVKIGIPTLGLLFSTPISVTIPIDASYNGQTVNVYYQRDGSTSWNSETTCTIVNALCTFTTNHATTFAVKKNEPSTSSGSSASSRYTNLLAMGNTQAASQLQQEFPNQINPIVINQPILTTPSKITKTLKQGLKNDTDVKTLQSYLNTYLKINLTIDGSFGLKTKQAVISFQKLNKLTPDGVVGPKTLKEMK
jgi:hypothetical protein